MVISENLSFHRVPEIPGYTLVEMLYLGSQSAVYRAVETEQQRPVVIKVLHREYPTFAELVQFRNQYTITKNLAIPGIVRPLNLKPFGNGYALVMEDWGGISLEIYAQQQPLSLTEILNIALNSADVLHDLHQNRVIHKDIKPANILIHPHSKQIKLIDFSIASLLPKELREIQSPNVLEGTLAYLAPEQTGRMNRGVDYRADFYGLGVTLYQLLTGQLPFASNDPLELLHCHLAKVPPAVEQVNPLVPAMVGAIVTKLMAKNADDRYQSALGLKYDLANCLNQWNATGAIATFALGQRDLSDRFLIPERLYGREAEVQTLLAAFERVAGTASADRRSPNSELMLVAGFSGIGKTAVVNEVHKPITQQRGYFIKGKFDQFNRNIPFSAFVQALRDLMGQLLSESDPQLQAWKAAILTALGENGQVLIDVIPELEHVIGKQPAAPELSGSEIQNRFNLLFQNFIGVFTTADHPLVIFLDDLQWADSASLHLLSGLMSNSHYLLVLGAYRDNEVSPAHPFMLMLKALKTTTAIVNTITLNPLTQDDTNRLVADTLNCSSQLAQPLTELIDRKTRGNPFFITQFLKALHEDGYITFDYNQRYWQCDIAQVKALTLTEDVVEFMAMQLQKLPVDTQRILKLAACIGNQFDLSTLAIVSQQSPIDTATQLWKGLQEGLILPITETYKFFQPSDGDDGDDGDRTAAIVVPYKFLHDRVQQAAYSLIQPDQKAKTHLEIGRLLLASCSVHERTYKLFDIVNQLNLGAELMTDEAERIQLAELNFAAGCKAKLATAYGAASAYLSVGIDQLGADGWQQRYRLSLGLYETAAEVAYLDGQFATMQALAEVVSQSARTWFDQMTIEEIKIMASIAQGELCEAIATGLRALHLLGIELPAAPTDAEIDRILTKTAALVPTGGVQELLHLPPLTDPIPLAALRILDPLFTAAYAVAPRLIPMISAWGVILSIRYGNAALSIVAYTQYGMLLCSERNQIEMGYQFGELALQLSSQFNDKALQTRVLCMVGAFILPWKLHWRAVIPHLQLGYQMGIEAGVLIYASFNVYHAHRLDYLAGEELMTLEAKLLACSQAIRQIRQELPLDYTLMLHQVVLNWLGQSANPMILTGSVYDGARSQLIYRQTNNHEALFYLHLHQAILAYSFSQNTAAIDHIRLAAAYLESVPGQIVVPLFYFYHSLIHLSCFHSVASSDQREILETIAANQAKMAVWAEAAPMNYLHKFQLVEAERACILGQKLPAFDLYDQAIAGAKNNDYLQDEALANELAAKLYLAWGKEKIAASYMQDAYYAYVRWGAKAKTDDLERTYPHLLQPILNQQRASLSATETVFAATYSPLPLAGLSPSRLAPSSAAVTTVLTTIDLSTVLKAFQTLSSEIELDKLLTTLLHTVLENAGADKAALLMPRQEQWYVEAVAILDQPARLQSIPLADSPDIPQSLINGVKRSRQPMVVADATVHLALLTDDYVMQQQPKSILCTPLLQQGKLVAILYLENRVVTEAFTSDRIELLNLLCTQAAISLETANLYQTLQQSETKFRAFVEDVSDLIYAVDRDGIFTYISPQFKEMWGYEVEEYLHQSFVSLVHPEDLESVVDFHHILFETGKKQSGLEFRAKHCNGSWFWITCNSSPIKDEQGTVIGLRGIARDISDRKAAEAVSKAYQARLEFLIQQTPLGVIEWNMEFKVVGWNPAAEKIFGYRAAEMLGHHAEQIVPESDRVQVAQVMQALISQEGGYYSLNQNIRSDHTVITCEWINTPLRDADGNSIGIFSMIQDVSDRILAEATILQKSQALEQALEELQKTQLQMVQSEKMVSLGNLVAGVAHEINNPIGFLNGSITNARDYINDVLNHLALYQQFCPNPGDAIQANARDIDLDFVREDLPKLLNSMQGATDRIKGISTSLRTFSRADVEHKVSVDLHEGLDSTLLILKYRLKANEHRPEIDVIRNYGSLPPVECFPGQLNQVFMNILANAIDVFDEAAQYTSYSELQTKTQIITIQTQVLAGNQVEIRIRDNGKGMTEDIKAKIFDHLFTTKSMGKGTGLGLAIARQIVVDKHGGTLEVESAVGEGTEFLIQLSIQDDDPPVL